MKRGFYIFILHMSMLSFSFSQNLVPNPSFEIYTSCPPDYSAWTDYLSYATGWSRAQCTPDYFNVCNNSGTGIVGIPNNFLGYQFAYNGNAYAGFVPVGCFKTTPDGAREYIRSKLLSPLKACATYRLRFYVSLSNFSTYAVGKIGAYFSKIPIGTGGVNCDALVYNSHVINTAIISDTAVWTQIEGTFIADGCEEYLTIGYFEPDITNDTLQIQPPVLPVVCPDFSYYYIDSVSVVEISPGQMQCLCPGETLAPNIFTPNGDGINDLFIVRGLERNDEVKVYDRWGIPVALFQGSKQYWDGYTSAGIKCNNGVYFYVIQKTDGEIIKGFVHLQY